MTAYLISATTGDHVPGVDIALLDGLPVLQIPAVQDWMTQQGYGPGNPGEVMLLSQDPAPEGFPVLELELYAQEERLFLEVLAKTSTEGENS